MTAWHDDHRNLARLAMWMVEGGYEVGDVVYMLEKPWAYEGEWREATDA